MKTCKHFRNQIPTYQSNELRLADKQPCEVCDVIDRLILCERTNQYIFIPKFNFNETYTEGKDVV